MGAALKAKNPLKNDDNMFGKGAEHFRADRKAAGVLRRSRRTLRLFVDFMQIECGKQPLFGEVTVRRKVPHCASEKAKKHPCQGAFFALAEAARFVRRRETTTI